MVTIVDILNQWEAIGVFDIVLPFLLIFAVVYGILTASNILSGNKGVNVTISLVIGLLALRLGFVQDFFREVFPRLGVGLAVFIILLILTGSFLPTKIRPAVFWIYFAIGAVIAIVVLGGAFSSTTFGGGLGLIGSDIIVWIVSIALLIGIIVVIVVSKADTTQDTSPATYALPLMRAASN